MSANLITLDQGHLDMVQKLYDGVKQLKIELSILQSIRAPNCVVTIRDDTDSNKIIDVTDCTESIVAVVAKELSRQISAMKTELNRLGYEIPSVTVTVTGGD